MFKWFRILKMWLTKKEVVRHTLSPSEISDRVMAEPTSAAAVQKAIELLSTSWLDRPRVIELAMLYGMLYQSTKELKKARERFSSGS